MGRDAKEYVRIELKFDKRINLEMLDFLEQYNLKYVLFEQMIFYMYLDIYPKENIS